MQIISTPTKELYIKVVQKLLDEGYTWSFDRKNIDEKSWDVHKEKTHIEATAKVLHYVSDIFYKKIVPDIPILSAEKFLKEASDLKVGDVLIDKLGCEQKILAMVDDFVVIAPYNSGISGSVEWYKLNYIKENWKIKGRECDKCKRPL